MAIEYEETVEYYKSLDISIVGIRKDRVPTQANLNMSDAELMAFYSERYVDVDAAEFLNRERKERLYGLCNLVKPGEFYLDVGCANGAHMAILHQRGIDGIGLDLSVPNILRGREKYPHLKFVHGFAEEIPFKDNHFDIVLLGDVIEHFRNPKVTLAECLRVARTGIALCVPTKPETTEEHINPFSCEAILNLLKFYKLKVQFYNSEGKKISQSEAEAKLEAFLWLLIRADKTGQTDAVVRGIIVTAGEVEPRQAVGEILCSDERCYNTEHERDEAHRNRFRLLSHLIEGQRALEIGCGNGDLSAAIAKLGFDVVGVDISEPGIRQAVELTKKENLNTKARFMVMDATSLEFPDNSFDTVLIPEVLEHVRDSRKLLEEAVRVVRNGGGIIASVPDGLSIPFPGHLRVFFKDTLSTELSQYAQEITWHELPFKKWLICSFFVKKPQLDITEGPLIDILMPTYNGRKYIKNAIKSIINQTYRNWNLVVVNDGGEDIKDILDEFKDTRIKYITAEHKGKAHALNVGIENSNGQFIGYLDDDDILYPIHLEVLVEAALEGNRDFLYSDWYEVSLDENNTELGRKFDYRLNVAPWMLIRKNYINHKCILHSRSLLREAGMYDEELDILIDWDMIRRLAFVCPPHHIWSVTSERICYYSSRGMESRISGLWERNPDKVRRSVERITNETTNLSATAKELKKALIDAMLHRSYYHELELNNIMQEKSSHIANLEASLQEKVAHIAELETSLQEKVAQIHSLESQIQQIQHSIPMQLVNRYQRVIEKLLRSGTRRRHYYELGLTGIRVILNEGGRSFFRQVKAHLPGKRDRASKQQ